MGKKKRDSNVRDCCEHSLVQTEQQVWNLGAAHTGLGQHVHQAKVGEVANVSTTRMAESQGVTPKEPLEPDNCYAHHRQPDEGQGRLPSCQTAVEETHARHHEQDEGGGGEDPCEVAGLWREREKEVLVCGRTLRQV